MTLPGKPSMRTSGLQEHRAPNSTNLPPPRSPGLRRTRLDDPSVSRRTAPLGGGVWLPGLMAQRRHVLRERLNGDAPESPDVERGDLPAAD